MITYIKWGGTNGNNPLYTKEPNNTTEWPMEENYWSKLALCTFFRKCIFCWFDLQNFKGVVVYKHAQVQAGFQGGCYTEEWDYCKDIEHLYHAFVYSTVSLILIENLVCFSNHLM